MLEAFPGRFTTIEPAAVDIQATDSGCADDVQTVHIAPDRDAERQFLPEPATLAGCVLLAGRGYPSVPHFEAVEAAGGAFTVRLTSSDDPWVRSAWVEGRRAAVPPRMRLSRVLAQYPGHHPDLDVEFVHADRFVGFRVVVIPGRDRTMSRLCTNLPLTPFSADLVARLYRVWWPIEFCFKEWKSYANLHTFNTANPHVAEGLLWASLCAAILKRFLAHAAQRVGRRVAMSTRRVAMCAHHMLEALVTALLVGIGLLGALGRGLAYPLANARRPNVERDHRTGRLRAGLVLIEATQ